MGMSSRSPEPKRAWTSSRITSSADRFPLLRINLARAALCQDHIAHTLGVGDRIEFLGGVHGGRGGERQVADPDHPLEEALVDVNRANVLGVNILVNL